MDLVISPSLHLERLVLSSFVGPHKAIIGSQTPSYLSSDPPHGCYITEASISAVSKFLLDSTLTLPELISLQVQGLLVIHTLGAMSHALMPSQLAKNSLIWSPHESSLYADLLTPHFPVTQGSSCVASNVVQEGLCLADLQAASPGIPLAIPCRLPLQLHIEPPSLATQF